MAKTVTLVLTPAQARAVNAGLALLEAELENDYDAHNVRPAVLENARAKVWLAMSRAGAPT
jgi:hypothetical protein